LAGGLVRGGHRRGLAPVRRPLLQACFGSIIVGLLVQARFLFFM